MSSHSVKSLRASYTGLYPQSHAVHMRGTRVGFLGIGARCKSNNTTGNVDGEKDVALPGSLREGQAHGVVGFVCEGAERAFKTFKTGLKHKQA